MRFVISTIARHVAPIRKMKNNGAEDPVALGMDNSLARILQ
jgi:hypothetical protein